MRPSSCAGRLLRVALLTAVVALLAAGSVILAQELDGQELLDEMRTLSEKLAKQFESKDYEGAAATCRRMIALAPNYDNPHYNLACALAQMGKTDEAMASLKRSVELGFADGDHMSKDPDLDSLHGKAGFDECVAGARDNAKRARGVYEKGIDLEGVKTVEGDPENGLRWRLRMSPDATKEKPQRLIVWLHPSGGSMNQIVERLAPRFNKAGYALVVFSQKQFRSWTSDEGLRLMISLKDMEKVEGISAGKPILIGYSAGGQMALELWSRTPQLWGGLVLDAAYPVRPSQAGIEEIALPENDAVKDVPMFVLVGDQDGGARLWTAVAPKWREAGVPLTYHLVAGKGHTWLFGQEQLKLLHEWLTEVAAGKKPSQAEPAKEPEPDDIPEVPVLH